MAHKRKRRVSGGSNTALWIVAGVAGAFALYEIMKPSTAASTTIIRAAPVSSSTATTTAEVAAGASVLSTIANDIFGDDNS